MRLLVNATSYGAVPGGAGLRARHLYGALHARGEHEIVFLLAADSDASIVPPGVESRTLPVRARDRLRRWMQLRLPNDGDALLTDHYPATDLPTHITLHDLGGPSWRRALIRRHLQRAAGIIAVSETVRAAWGVDASVVPNGVSLAPPHAEHGDHLLLCDPGLPHKGASVARAVAARLGRELREVGRGVRWLPQAELRDELGRARVVLCPARAEGFGMVALEALAVGRPVVASDIPAHREVCGDAALYAPVDDVDAWCEAVHVAWQSASARNEGARQSAGARREWAARWSWEASAEALSRHLKA